MKLNASWLGLELTNPFVPSASPLSRSLDLAKRLEDAGAAALVMYSLFEEAIEATEGRGEHPLPDPQTAEDDPMVDPFPQNENFPGRLDRYLEQVAALKAALDIPIIASLNGITAGGWMRHAKEIEEAGADALELNAYYIAGDIWEEGPYVEQRYVTLLNQLCEKVDLPINMKLSPYFSSIGNLVKKLEAAGAAGITLFNRFYQPDIDIENDRLTHTLVATQSSDALLAMRWMAILHGRVECSLSATGGVHTGADAIKLLLAGADVVHVCHALLEHGPEHITTLIGELELWMEQRGFESLTDFRGKMSQENVLDPSDYERLNYIRVLQGEAERHR